MGSYRLFLKGKREEEDLYRNEEELSARAKYADEPQLISLLSTSHALHKFPGTSEPIIPSASHLGREVHLSE